MHASAQPHDGGRAVDLLLRHCAALDRLDDERPPAYERLAAALGEDMARMLVTALAGGDRSGRASRLYAA